jgi:hypothetical protein
MVLYLSCLTVDDAVLRSVLASYGYGPCHEVYVSVSIAGVYAVIEPNGAGVP